MNRDLALKAVDAAFESGIDRLHQVFVDGLIIGTDPATLTTRFRNGFKNHVEAHQRISDAVEAYFKDGK
jgi:hypothetical protein